MKHRQTHRANIVSTLSNLSINLKSSVDYVRLSMVLHGLGLIVLYEAQYGWFCCVMVSVGLFFNLRSIAYKQKPHPDLQAFLWSDNAWLLITAEGEFKTYNHARICLDAGFFTLCCFSSATDKRYCVIFHDQLPLDALKMLYVLSKQDKGKFKKAV